ncbi:phosphotransferase family protein [Bacillus sp. Au-Bac7]|uniref:phosphotransferase family protein n=1 Tax=Bacillus sp. Au-Bac7 TaxID=2906458 RepID=UPI001E4521ED|nr:aminoglycoside phosphotransferase family protein [Bacillus sp. Au-Bac7]MCE4047930.1 aminoglycoside phosphotransferase family protein [Bacillus sp. Au-Bac7]
MNLGNPIATGNTANLYLLDSKIMKVFKDFLPQGEAYYEAKKQQYAYSKGLNAPKVLEVKNINDSQAIVMEYIYGETLGQQLLNDLEHAERYMKLLINVQTSIHAVIVEADALEPLPERLKSKLQAVSCLNDIQKQALLLKLKSLKHEHRLCHGDLHPFNLIATDKEVYIIDWVDASAGDRLADICRTYLLFLSFSIELAELYIDMYCKHTTILKGEILEWLPIIAGARLYENVSAEENKLLMKMVNEYCSR